MRLKIIYIAADSELPREQVQNLISKFSGDAFDPDCMNGFFFAPNLIGPDKTKYADEDEESAVNALLQFTRRFDEIWLIGPDIPDEEFDARFRLELRSARMDSKPVRRFKLGQNPETAPAVTPETKIYLNTAYTPAPDEPGVSICRIQAVMKYGSRHVPLTSLSEFPASGKCFDVAVEKHVDVLDDYIAALQAYRKILDTSEVYNLALRN